MRRQGPHTVDEHGDDCDGLQRHLRINMNHFGAIWKEGRDISNEGDDGHSDTHLHTDVHRENNGTTVRSNRETLLRFTGQTHVGSDDADGDQMGT